MLLRRVLRARHWGPVMLRLAALASLISGCRTEQSRLEDYAKLRCDLAASCQIDGPCNPPECPVDWDWLRRCEEDTVAWQCGDAGSAIGPPSCSLYLVLDCPGMSEPKELPDFAVP
jgi:hypothetical protein